MRDSIAANDEIALLLRALIDRIIAATMKVKTGSQTASGVTIQVTAGLLVAAGQTLDVTAYRYG